MKSEFLRGFRSSLALVVIGGVFLFVVFLFESALFSGKIGGESVVIGGVEIRVDIADDAQERERGLSGRETLEEGKGMLFIFEKSGFWGFWMKDMLFSIDIIWVGDDMKVVHVEENISPETYPVVFTPPQEARYVLEVRSGFTRAEGIGEGALLEL